MFVNKKIIEKLKKLALKAKNLKEVPISCVIAKNDKIISSAYNTCLSTGNPLNHAEMLAIKKALIKTKKKQVGVYPIDDESWIDVGQWSEYHKAVDRLI